MIGSAAIGALIAGHCPLKMTPDPIFRSLPLVTALALWACAPGPRAPAASDLEQLSTAAASATWDLSSRVLEDFDCDSRADAAYLGHRPSEVLVGIVRSGGEAPQILDFAIGADVQRGVCAPPLALELEGADDDPADDSSPIEEWQRLSACRGLRLSGAACDTIHVFWNHGTGELDWWPH